MEHVAKLLLVAAAILAAGGLAVLIAAKLGIDRLPGDIVIRRENLTVDIPVGLMIAVSVIGSLVLSLLRRL